MGCWAKLKPEVKKLREEITREAMAAAGRIVQLLDVSIADGKLTKQEAGNLGSAVLVAAFGLTLGAAQGAIIVAVRTFSERHAAEDPEILVDLDDDVPAFD